MKKIRIMGLLLFIITVISCDINGKKDIEVKMKQEQQKFDVVQGQVGSKSADISLSGSKFLNETKYLEFDKNTNSCRITMSQQSQYPQFAEYILSDKTITFDCKKFSTVMANYDIEDCEKSLRLMFEKMSPQLSAEELDKQVKQKIDTLKKQHYIEKANKLYSEYLKQPLLEGELSADQKSIMFRKFTIPDNGKIVEIENIVFTRE